MWYRNFTAVSLALLLFALSLPGCMYSQVELPGINQLPVVHSFEASPAGIKPGEYSTLSWTVTNASRVFIDNNIGDVALSGNIAVSPGSTTYYTLTASNASGSSSVRTQIIVTAPAQIRPPVITSFYASKNYINPGEAVTLYWSTSDTSSVSLEPGGAVSLQGSKTVFPTADTVYVLTASNQDRSVTAAAAVNVQRSGVAGNPVISFTAQHLGGTMWQLNWNVANATQILIEPDIGQVQPSGSVVVSVPSGQVRLYKLTAANAWGWAYWQVIVASP